MTLSEYVLKNYENVFSMQPEDIPDLGSSVLIPRFPKEVIGKICTDAITVLQNSSALRNINTNVIVVGDLHGNLHDLVRILIKNGLPPKKNYLFLGDLVDRGSYSIEVVTLLLSLLNVYPDNITILRGNHEYADINEKFGFKESVKTQFNDEVLWETINEVFSYLPIAAIIKGHIFCVHGGVSPELNSLKDIESLTFPILECPALVASLLWSDPVDSITEYSPSSRGLGYDYGPAATEQFLKKVNCDTIIRGHQSVASGIKKDHNGKVITVFSTSNYGDLDNVAAFIKIDQDIKEVIMEPITIPTNLTMFAKIPNPTTNQFSASCKKMQTAPMFSNKIMVAARRAPLMKSAKVPANRKSVGLFS
ncbi:Ser/Thr protein phosphatase, putative [Trichomonas vaginalis G3]|uniref:Serine/threonine-protein phosphatase n=1 Tax=Trichomonas vaginalis (strain ATCC PRA-98 / G3) TaxID=412133 RepID=A2DD24_TRIV3|nr:phosphoprotein phosphatase protein [Trichomonas vaginalis G3]EAY21798.1 Ser/Thr protein phosphatase, putative [Trichomonas vaginalis G3]KAI5524246.1 phosphoprotein phosphatase protein [Trichomonas vaginalis G3]|eukprot:XP_001582784.1 Ser/Thr protein phosphatase [Trichomonas vaginalis G3]